MSFLPIIAFTVGVSVLATLLLIVPGTLLAWVLARRRFVGKSWVEALVSLPMVLPPTATGFLLLLGLGPASPLGRWLESAGITFVFDWKGVVLASAIVALPLYVRALRSSLEQLDPALSAVARSLGQTAWGTFWRVELPLAWRGLAAGAVLAFARALGEFGATIVLAGNIPGRTQTVALALFQRIQAGRYEEAWVFAAAAAALGFAAIWFSERLSRSHSRRIEESP